LVQFQRGFESGFEKFRAGYRSVLHLALLNRIKVITVFMGFILASFALVPYLGSNFFPDVDGGQILIHARVPVGTRVEETAARFAAIEKTILKVIPPEEITTLVDNIGLPPSWINLIYNNTGVIGTQDGDIQIALRKGHKPTADYVRELRKILPTEFPDTVFSFPPADIVSQILNFGAPAPIDIQIRGANLAANFEYANTLLKAIRGIPGVADARIQQSAKSPVFDVNMDRGQAQELGITPKAVRDIWNLRTWARATRPHWTPLDEEAFTKKKSCAAFCDSKRKPTPQTYHNIHRFDGEWMIDPSFITLALETVLMEWNE
jgi:multidrug efflux pump subunit AcrB